MKRKYSDDKEDGVAKKKSKRDKREKQKKHKRKHSKRKARSSSSNDDVGPLPAPANVGPNKDEQSEISKAFQPMTKEQWEKEQNKITRVFDKETGRHRLIRGNGEIIEEIVSKDRQKEINRKATAMDGKFYQDHAQKLFK